MQIIAMKDMAKTPAEMKAELIPVVEPLGAVNEYPYGLCLCLDEDSITKLGIDPLPEVGDGAQIIAMVKVTSVSSRDTGDGPCRRVELQITHLAIDEDSETVEGE